MWVLVYQVVGLAGEAAEEARRGCGRGARVVHAAAQFSIHWITRHCHAACIRACQEGCTVRAGSHPPSGTGGTVGPTPGNRAGLAHNGAVSIVLEGALIGIAVGVVIGTLGGGGGIVSVPVLVYLLGQSPHNAAASSLVIVGSSSLVSLIPHARRGNVDWRTGGIFAVASVAGNLAGARLSALIDGDILMVCFAGLLLAVAALMAHRAVRAHRRARRHALDPDALPPERVPGPWNLRRVLVVLVTATLVGALTGFFGVGGGFAVVPALLVALYLPMKSAVGTSLLVLVFASAVGLLGRVGQDISPDWPLTFAFAATSIVGALIGSRISRSARPEVLTAAFATLLTAVAVFTAVSAVPALLG